MSAVARYVLSFLAALLLAALLLPPLLRIASPLAESWAEGAEAVVRYLSEAARDESARPQDAPGSGAPSPESVPSEPGP